MVELESDLPHNRLNDGKVDRAGRFVFGSMDTLEEAPRGKLYSYSPDGTLAVLDEGIVCSNGPCFSPDGKDVVLHRHLVGRDLVLRLRPHHRCSVATDGPSRTSTPASEGRPTAPPSTPRVTCGSALVYGGKIIRHAPDGSVDRTIDFPVLKVTSSCSADRPRHPLRHLDGQAAIAPIPR